MVICGSKLDFTHSSFMGYQRSSLYNSSSLDALMTQGIINVSQRGNYVQIRRKMISAPPGDVWSNLKSQWASWEQREIETNKHAIAKKAFPVFKSQVFSGSPIWNNVQHDVNYIAKGKVC